GFPLPALSLSGALPSGVSFGDNGNGTGQLQGTPAAGTGGIYTLLFSATNSAGTATQTFTLTVNEAPAITSAPGASFQTGQFGTFTVTTTGFPHPALSKTGALPSGVTMTDNGNGTATISDT